jgi:hypothetical protein
VDPRESLGRGGLRALGQLASTHVVNKLRCLRAPGESFSDAILRIADETKASKPR